MILLVLTLGILTFYFSRPSIKTVEKENIVVIGASQGIGKELSLKLAKRNCNLILVSRQLDQLLELKSQLETLDNKPKIHIFQADWTSEKQLELLLEYVKTQFKSLNSLFLCAGVLSVSTFEELLEIPESAEIIQSIFNVNSIGPILTTKMFLPLLIESKGLLVVLSSTAGVVAAPTRTLYCATKHALTGFFRALRIEVKNKGITVLKRG
jgi:dehydrogenase/reductase SDR family protein 7